MRNSFFNIFCLVMLFNVFVLSEGFAQPASPPKQPVVHVYNWSNYIDEQIIKDFTRETGIKVIYDVFDSNDVLENRLLSGGYDYDVVVPSARFLSRQLQIGLFQPLDKKKLPNLKYMWDIIAQKTEKYDPLNEYSVNYMWGTTGIGYNAKKIQERLGVDKIVSWKSIFDPIELAKLSDCGVVFIDSATDIVPIILNYLGLNPDARDAVSLARVEILLASIRPHIREFSSSGYIEGLVNGDICVAIGFSGDMFQARSMAQKSSRPINIEYSIPQEGTLMWFDQMAIPSDAKNIDEAHAFINYIMRPQIAAQISNHIVYANGNKSSQEFIHTEIINNPSVYPNSGIMQKLFTITSTTPKDEREILRIWTKIIGVQ